MTCHAAIVLTWSKAGDLARTDRLRYRTALVKTAARRRIAGAGHFALQQPALATTGAVKCEVGRKQGLRIGMSGSVEELGSRPGFDNLTEIHDGHTIGDASTTFRL